MWPEFSVAGGSSLSPCRGPVVDIVLCLCLKAHCRWGSAGDCPRGWSLLYRRVHIWATFWLPVLGAATFDLEEQQFLFPNLLPSSPTYHSLRQVCLLRQVTAPDKQSTTLLAVSLTVGDCRRCWEAQFFFGRT